MAIINRLKSHKENLLFFISEGFYKFSFFYINFFLIFFFEATQYALYQKILLFLNIILFAHLGSIFGYVREYPLLRGSKEYGKADIIKKNFHTIYISTSIILTAALLSNMQLVTVGEE